MSVLPCPGRAYLPSSFLMTLASCGARTTSWLRRRVSFEDLPSRLWRMPAPCFITLPLPVTLNRFFAPECVFCLGIAAFLFYCFGLSGFAGCDARRLGGLLFGLLGLCFSLRVDLALERADHHDHVASVDRRSGLDGAELGDVFGETLEQTHP